MGDSQEDILELSQSLDLFGRHAALARAMQEHDFKAASALVKAAILDAQEMTRPDRTHVRRKVHLKNFQGLKKLDAMLDGLLD
jgi:hypothetical protein